ncbi:MAG: hypothetical protein H6Q52_2805 [Deltaproteobacteria bacterium]|nr:hypothetical protein [Deltaproteobacteria bacterium]
MRRKILLPVKLIFAESLHLALILTYKGKNN